MKHVYKKILSFLTIICCVAGSLGTVRASESENVPRVVFVNEQKDLPDLYVGKTVVSPEGYTAPGGDAFTFLLTLDGEPATRRSYVLCDISGTELTKDQVNQILGLNLEQNTFTTGSNGTFTLRDGLMAKFTGVGVGADYVVTELPDASGRYEQTTPAGGQPARGVMEKEGKEIVFVNTYTPALREGRATLEVTKTIEFPDGYQAPATPDFTFCLTVDGSPYGNQPYSVRDDMSGGITGEGTTSADGTFTLQGGQTAVFAGDDLEAGMDYQVTEEQISEGWHAVGETAKSGALTAPLTRASFHNSEVSFVVTKRMEDDTRPDKAFTFQLIRADDSLWSGAEYYLYDLRGNLVTEEDTPADRPAEKETTKPDGTFTLKPGQAAVFTGLAPGTGYSVREVGDPDYIQVQPLTIEGYTERTVQESPVEILPFKNQEAPKIPTLAVTKVVEYQKGDASDPQDEFCFILRKKDGDNWKPVDNAGYTITVGSSEITGKTDAQGRFTLKANETARFTRLLPGEYQVEETGLEDRPDYQIKSVTVTGPDSRTTPAPDAEKAGTDPAASAAGLLDSAGMETESDTSLLNAGSSVSAGGEAGTDAAALADSGYDVSDTASSGSTATIPTAAPESKAAGILGTSGTTEFLFANVYRPDKLDLALAKASPSGTLLEGAVFRLWKAPAGIGDGSFDQIKDQLESIESLTSDAEGHLTFQALDAGTYYLEETTAPPGYRVLEAPVKIVVTRDASNKPAVTVTKLSGEDHVTHQLIEEPNTRDRLELRVTDQYIYELPSTGGPGVGLYYAAGALLLLLAAVLCLHSSRSGK